MTDVNVVKVSDLDPTMFDVTNSAGDNLIKIIGQQNPAAEFKQVTNLDTDILGKGFVPFFGIVKKAEQKNVLNLPKFARYSVLESEKSSDASHYVSDNSVVVGYQITSRGNIEQRVAVGTEVWVRTNNGGTFNQSGELVTPNVGAWSKWVRDTVSDFLRIFHRGSADTYSFEFSDDVWSLKSDPDEFEYREEFPGFSKYENLLTKGENGIFVGLKGRKRYQIVYVDNTTATGTDADAKRGSGTKADPFVSLHFLRQIVEHTRTIVLLKGGTNKVYEVPDGRGKNSDGTGIRIFTTYGDDTYDAKLAEYRGSPGIFGANHIHGFEDFPRAKVRSSLSEDKVDGANKPLVSDKFFVRNDGVTVFENIDFVLSPDTKGLNTDRGANIRTYGIFNNEGGSMVFNYCGFEVPADAAVSHTKISPFRLASAYGKRSNLVFNGCKFDIHSSVSAINPYVFVSAKPGDYIEINDITVDDSNIPPEFSGKTMRKGNVASSLTRRIALPTGVPKTALLSNVTLEVKND